MQVAAGASLQIPAPGIRRLCQNLGFHLKTKEQMDFSLCGCTVMGETRKFKDLREQKANEEKSCLLQD